MAAIWQLAAPPTTGLTSSQTERYLAESVDEFDRVVHSFPKAVNDDASDSAAYQVEIAQAALGYEENLSVADTRAKLTQNQTR